MAPKRPIGDVAAEPVYKKHRSGFKIGPDNLPDGTYRRKGTTPRCVQLYTICCSIFELRKEKFWLLLRSGRGWLQPAVHINRVKAVENRHENL
jgi:hypothetical protein